MWRLGWFTHLKLRERKKTLGELKRVGETYARCSISCHYNAMLMHSFHVSDGARRDDSQARSLVSGIVESNFSSAVAADERVAVQPINTHHVVSWWRVRLGVQKPTPFPFSTHNQPQSTTQDKHVWSRIGLGSRCPPVTVEPLIKRGAFAVKPNSARIFAA